MMSIGGAIILLIFGFPIIVVVGFFLVWALKIAKGDKEGTSEEARIIQEIHVGLDRLDKRVEALETILLDLDGKGDRK
jgi:phage shock protein B